MTELVFIYAAVYSGAELMGLLPGPVRERLEPAVLAEAATAAALRVLSTIDDPAWQAFVRPALIEWSPLLAWARSKGTSNSVHVRVEIAASLAGRADARPDLSRAVYKLDEGNFAAVLDAWRIARRGVVL